jgi:hypothetical protein
MLEVRGISDRRLAMVGVGYAQGGVSQACLAHIPEPGTLAIVAFGVFAIARRQRHRWASLAERLAQQDTVLVDECQSGMAPSFACRTVAARMGVVAFGNA